MELVTADRLQDDGRGVGEMHCIVRAAMRSCSSSSVAAATDCALFQGMRGHTANVVGLGEEHTGAFNAAHEQARVR